MDETSVTGSPAAGATLPGDRQYGQIIDVYVSPRRDTRVARRVFATACPLAHGEPTAVVTDRAPALRATIDELTPATFHNTEQDANNRVECDHGRLKARLRPMRGLERDHTAGVVMRVARVDAEPVSRPLRNSGLTPATTGASRSHSPNSPGRSEREPGRHLGTSAARSNSTQQRPRERVGLHEEDRPAVTASAERPR